MWLTLLSWASQPLALAADDADAIVDQWVTEKGEARFEIFKANGKYNGKIVWLKEPTYPAGDEEAGKPVRDRKNPDTSKRDRPIVGLQLLNDFTYAGRNTYTNGTIYNADDGKTYKARLTLKSPDKLHVRGYVGISLLGGTTVWTRYEKPKESSTEKAEPKE
jgi:uncharacterized protein (DUF2147 family)